MHIVYLVLHCHLAATQASERKVHSGRHITDGREANLALPLSCSAVAGRQSRCYLPETSTFGMSTGP
ncbi:hypothetical protein FA13DRAFT_1510365 [Coprinellus micaceus]|uniref:Secreted protein n=1 Tax=Coprinellus micaceus TaxID=71717 RepID=A0A4Y7SI48_COPMI|nr:hypothetical protein FA13DRAFT_139290 [Coprinellus micaceus]TEB22463.1 hypothetical protein FA13DRAFT_1510365 [Coprinellus micaceus]